MNNKKFNLMSQKQLNKAFLDACYERDLVLIEYLLISPELTIHADIHTKNDEAFLLACNDGYLDVVDYLLTSDKLKEHANIQAYDPDTNKSALGYAAKSGNIEIIKYLLTSSKSKKNIEVREEDSVLELAAYYNKLKIIDYLLTVTDIKIFNPKKVLEALFSACMSNNTEIIDYLYNFLKDKEDFYTNKLAIFTILFKENCSFHIERFLKEEEVDDSIMKLLNNTKNENLTKICFNIIDKKKLHNKLNTNFINYDHVISKIVKI